MNTLIKPEGLQEEQIEGATNIDPYTQDNFSAQVPIDQDFIRNVAISNSSQRLPAQSKIGINEDVETFQDIVDANRQASYNQRALEMRTPPPKTEKPTDEETRTKVREARQMAIMGYITEGEPFEIEVPIRTVRRRKPKASL